MSLHELSSGVEIRPRTYIGILEETESGFCATFPDFLMFHSIGETPKKLMGIVEHMLAQMIFMNGGETSFNIPWPFYQGERHWSRQGFHNFTAEVTMHPENEGSERYQVKTSLDFKP